MSPVETVMKLMTGDELWPTIAKTSKAASSTRAAISYVTSDTYLHLHSGDVLIADASDPAIEKGQTSAKTLARLHSAGVRLSGFSRSRDHAGATSSPSRALISILDQIDPGTFAW